MSSSGGNVSFSYEVDNRRFSHYEADIDVSLWHNQVKLADLQSKTLALGAFDTEQVDWVLSTDNYIPENLPAGTNYDLIVLIKRGEIERRVILYVSPRSFHRKQLPYQYLRVELYKVKYMKLEFILYGFGDPVLHCRHRLPGGGVCEIPVRYR